MLFQKPFLVKAHNIKVYLSNQSHLAMKRLRKFFKLLNSLGSKRKDSVWNRRSNLLPE